jgi:hypothetical protein
MTNLAQGGNSDVPPGDSNAKELKSASLTATEHGGELV